MQKLILIAILMLSIVGFGQWFDRNGYGNDSQTQLMLHMDGANDGTTFTDSSPYGRAVTDTNAVTKTAIKKYTTASGYFDGAGDYLTIPDDDAWSITSKDFTVDFWAYRLDTANVSYNFSCGISGDFYDLISTIVFAGYVARFRYTVGSVSIISIDGTKPILENTWYHFAVVKAGNLYSLYVNGFLENSDTSYVTLNPTGGFKIGTTFGTVYMNGYIDEFRYSSFARWTKPFTPPNRAY